MMTTNKIQNTVSKIAIINPYLQGGHTLIAESETTTRFIQAGKNLSIDIRFFASSNDIYEFDPDFVINITYQEGKLTHYPTYVSLNIPVFFLKDVPRFIRNILSCDGFLTVSPSVSSWLTDLCLMHNKKPFISHTAFSVPQTEFVSCDFKKALAMYVGTNWDGMRHQDIFHYLSDGKYLKCFGPKKSWQNYPSTLYGGEIPFDGVSVFKAYRQHSIGLCIGHPEFDRAGVANTRIFEIAASSALPICMPNELTENIYGDTVLYLDAKHSTQDLGGQITALVQWARDNHKIAHDMAEAAHSRFNQNASMEFYIKNLLTMHESAMKGNGFVENVVDQLLVDKTYFIQSHTKHQDAKVELYKQKVAYLLLVEFLNTGVEAIVKDINSQSFSSIELIVLSKADLVEVENIIKNLSVNNLKIHYLRYEGIINNTHLFNLLHSLHVNWISVVSCHDRIFSNHTLTMIQKYSESLPQKKNIAGIFSGCLEQDDKILPELMKDPHNIIYDNNARIKYTKFEKNAPLVALFLSVSFFETISQNNLYELNTVKLLQHFSKDHIMLENTAITCAITLHSKYNLSLDLTNLTQEESIIFLIKKIRELQKELAKVDKKNIEIYSSRSWSYLSNIKKILRFFHIIRT